MKKALIIIKNILLWTIVVFAVLMTIFTIISVNTFNRNDRQLMGYKLYIVNSDSMSATDFKAGDLIMVKEVDPKSLEEGDIITFISQDKSSFGETVTHKIRKKTTDARGNPGFVTYGTTTDTDDETIVTYMYILGKYENKVPGMGRFFNFMKTPAGYVVCIFIPFMLLIIYQGAKSFMLFRRYKQQQMADMQGEKDQLASEREKNAQMLAELEALRAKLGEQGVGEQKNDDKQDAGNAPAEVVQDDVKTESSADAGTKSEQDDSVALDEKGSSDDSNA